MLRARVDPATGGSEHAVAAISTRRIWIFRVLAGLAGCIFLLTLPQAISPWGAATLSNTSGVHDLNLHRWSAALAGGPDLGMAAVLLYLAWRPMRAPLLLQWLALAVLIFLAANVPFLGPLVALIAVPVVLVLAAYPDPRSLLRPPWADGGRLRMASGPGQARCRGCLMQAIETSQAQTGRGGPLQVVRRHPLISYFLIAFAFTWAYDLVFLVFFPLPDVLGRSTPRDLGPL